MSNSRDINCVVNKSNLWHLLWLFAIFALSACSGGGNDSTPKSPVAVFATSASQQVTITWSPVLGASSYNIYWDTSPGVTTSSNKISKVTSPYVQDGLTDGATYYYRVSAVDSSGEYLSEEVFTFLYVGGKPVGAFVYTKGNMSTPRKAATATLLKNGMVLIAGGSNGVDTLATSELYDPVSDTFTVAGTMNTPRAGHTATLLHDGTVLIAGGGLNEMANTAEIYDPASDSFVMTGTMVLNQYGSTATLLPGGKVLIAGGYYANAELYNPETGSFKQVGSLHYLHFYNTSTLLFNGTVLIAGGSTDGRSELYSPASGTFFMASGMNNNRESHTASLLANGNVLLTGGFDVNLLLPPALSSTEIYNTSEDSFSLVGAMNFARGQHTTTLLPNGQVLVVGGNAGYPSLAALDSAEIYDDDSKAFTNTAPMNLARYNHCATLLPSGQVLIVGGTVGNTAELFQ